jgi:ribonuclease E
MKRMLFNATQQEEIRVAIVDGQKLIDLDIETSGKEQRKGNIYKGVITRIEPSLEAAFVDYSADRHGFLSFKEISRQYFAEGIDASRARIQDALREGQEVIVQVDKDERGTKGAALTTYVSLAGRYVVLMPNNPRGGGVSRRVEGEERNELRDAISQLEVPSGMSIIARTAGIGRSVEELNRDLNYLMRLWKAIENASKSQSGAFLIYQEGSLVIRAIRDYFQHDIGELLIDNESIFEQARQFMGHVMPENVNRVKLYGDDVPLFSRFQIEHQIETAYARQVPLPSGGAIVIDHTEALVSIDVNSARATKGHDIEATALNTNLEAADEIARQLRLRDLGGLVVIDFIDMESAKNQREVENRRDALHYDRARVQIGKISRFGLMELSRQRLQTSLGETSHIPCPRCHGIGHIRGIESSALHVLRILQEEAMKENTAAVHAQVPIEVATYLLNEKRAEFHSMEARLKVSVVLIPNMHLETPNYTVTRLRHDELNQTGPLPASYQMVEAPSEADEQVPGVPGEKPQRPEAAVKGVTPEQPIAPRAVEPPPPAPKESSILQKIFGWLTRKPEETAPEVKAPPRSRGDGRRGGRDGGERRDRRPQDGRGRGGEGRGEGEGRRRGRGGDRDRNQPQQQQGGAPAGEREEAAARGPQQPQGEGRNRQRSQKQRGEGREGREPREAREPREPREPRQSRESPRDGERDNAPQQQGRLTERPAGADAGPTEGGSGEGRGRRRRGRRDRQRGEGLEADRNNQGQADEALHTTGEALPAPLVQASVPEAAAPVVAVAMPSFMLPPVEREAPAPVAEAEPTVEVESEPEAAAAVEEPAAPSAPRGFVEMFSQRIADPVNPPVVEPLTVPVPPAPPAMEPIQLPEGMVMIETRSDRAAPVVEEAAPEVPRRPRPRPQPVVSDEPMQQVETRNK